MYIRINIYLLIYIQIHYVHIWYACTCIYVCMCILCKHIICVSVSTSGVAELVFVDFFNGNKDEFRITKIRIGEER